MDWLAKETEMCTYVLFVATNALKAFKKQNLSLCQEMLGLKVKPARYCDTALFKINGT